MVALAMLVSTAIASAQNTQTVSNGTTTLTFATGLVSAINGAGISLGTVSPSQFHSNNSYVTFPEIGGAIDLDTGGAQIIHSGGLTVTAGATKVVLQSFIIDTTTGTPVVTGLVSVNGTLLGRLPIFDLSLSSAITLPLTTNRFGQFTISGVSVTLDSAIAGLLNSTLGNPGLTGGLPIGTATINPTV
jgi:hypothetical protein